MRVIALDNFDNRREGEEFDCPDRQAEQLRKKGLVKIGPKPKNKMAPEPDNKSNPTVTAGKAKQSSASPAVRVSGKKTAQPYQGGGLVIPDQRFVEADEQTATSDSAEPNTTGSLL